MRRIVIGYNLWRMAGLIEAIDIKRKMYFEFEGAPYHCLDVDISKPTARGGQTLVRIKMRTVTRFWRARLTIWDCTMTA